MRREWIQAAAMAIFVLTIAPCLYADVISPDVSACSGKSVGARCTASDSKPGLCCNVTNGCCRVTPPHDGVAPGTSCSDCMQCVTGVDTCPGDAGKLIANLNNTNTASQGCSSLLLDSPATLIPFAALLAGLFLVVRLRRDRA